MEKKITTSIALATYNGDLYLQEQLKSILNQTIQPEEVIISDDNSTDNTISIIQEFKKKAPFKVVLLKNKGNEGFNNNFKKALINTTEEIVFICDQDDVWFENKIEKIIDYFKSHKDKELVIHDLEFCDSDLNKINQTKIGRFKIKNASLENYNTGMATAVRRKFLKSCFPFSSATNYDTWIHLCSSLLNVRGVYDRVLSYYRRHEVNATKLNPINASYKTNWLHLIKGSLRKTNFSSLEKEPLLINNLISFTSEHRANLSNIDADFNHIEKKLRDRLLNSYKRNVFIQKNFTVRLPKAVLFYCKGCYENQSGFKTMLRDVFIGVKK
jgi:glycosyltransferase involved in cell wall biosynthesis